MEEKDLKRTEECNLYSSCPEYEWYNGLERTKSEIHTSTVLNLLRTYEDLIQFVQRDDFDGDFKEELDNVVRSQKSVCREEPYNEQNSDKIYQPEYIEEFKTRMKDLRRMECGITIAGETSSGKTSLMNKLVGERLVTPQHLAATSRIVRIRNSENSMYRIFDKEGNEIENCTLNNIKDMRKTLDKNTGAQNADFHYIDVYFPFKRLQVQGNVMLVDTPGIGETDEMTEMLLEYLPNAFAFIFVIDVSHAGGVQRDRIQKILETIMEQKSSMPCFELEDVLFVTNKWNYINEDEDDDDSDEEDGNYKGKVQKKSQKEKTLDAIVNKLSGVWIPFNEKNVYKLNLQKVKEKDDKDEEKVEFERFCRALTDMLERNKHKRIKTHLRFLDKTIRSIETGILARIHAATGDDEQIIIHLHSTLQELEGLKEECRNIMQILENKINDAVLSLTKQLKHFLHSVEGREQILNPPGKKRIEKHVFINSKVSDRLEKGLVKWMTGTTVLDEINEIEILILEHFTKVKLKIQSAQLTLTGELKLEPLNEKLETTDIIAHVAGCVLAAPILLSGLLVAGSIGAVAAPFIFMRAALEKEDNRKMSAFDSYDRQVEMWEKEHLDEFLKSKLKKHFDEKIKAIFEKELPQEIANSASMIENLLQKRGYTKEQYETFLSLKDGIQHLTSDVSNMLTCFEER